MSKIFTSINNAVKSGNLIQPFTVKDVNQQCSKLLNKSPSFLSKHAKNNPGGYKEYFIRVSTGDYKLK
jgi:hypothetical protein